MISPVNYLTSWGADHCYQRSSAVVFTIDDYYDDVMQDSNITDLFPDLAGYVGSDADADNMTQLLAGASPPGNLNDFDDSDFDPFDPSAVDPTDVEFVETDYPDGQVPVGMGEVVVGGQAFPAATETVGRRAVDEIDSPTPERRSKRARTMKRPHFKTERSSSSASMSKCMSKNAVAARENREKKKQYITDLERRVKELAKENNQLRQNQGQWQAKAEGLKHEVAYLRAVLGNIPEIRTLIARVATTPNLEVTTSLGVVPKNEPLWDEPEQPSSSSDLESKNNGMEAAAGGGSVRRSQRIKDHPPGICFHLANRKVSLEFCRRCDQSARMAKKS